MSLANATPRMTLKTKIKWECPIKYIDKYRLFDVAEERHAAHDPVPGPDVGLEVDGADVVELSPTRLPVDRTLVQLAVLPCNKG